jgi:molybdate transport system substrate-binding protein
MLRRTSTTIAVAAAVVAGVASLAQAAARAQLTVYAAASLTDVLPQIDARERYSFGGSNTLAAQIQQGAPADVFASANMTLPAQLYARNLCSKPVVFTRNELVVVVPASNPAGIRSVFDLTKNGVKLVIAGAGVPVGGYTLQVLEQMNLTENVLQNVVSRETDVREVLSKVALGEADAGFVYATDARTARGKVKVIKVPAWAEPKIAYGVCVVDSSANKAEAQLYVNHLVAKAAQAKLVAAGFLPRVKPAPKKK